MEEVKVMQIIRECTDCQCHRKFLTENPNKYENYKHLNIKCNSILDADGEPKIVHQYLEPCASTPIPEYCPRRI